MVDEPKALLAGAPIVAGTSLIRVPFGTLVGVISDNTDVEDRHFTGDIVAPHDFENHNYVRCFFDGNVIANFHILHMDFKDTTLAGATIDACKIESSAFVNCVFNEVVFRRGTFFNCTFQDCRFFECRFEDVDLGNAFVKGCRISSSLFSGCTTDTHIFEECLFSKTKFVASELQIATILKNYGLSNLLLSDCRIRDRRPRESGRPLSQDELESFSVPPSDLIGRLRLEYFRSATFLDGNETLDACLTDHSWLVGLHNDFTIGDKVSQFVEFILNLWEDDELPCHTLLLAHRMTTNLVETLRSEEQELYRVLLTIMGTHMLLSRKVERYMLILDIVRAQLSDGIVVLVVNGPADPNYYVAFLPELFGKEHTRIVEARPHNSPSELYIYGAPALAWFLASLERFRLETYSSDRSSRGGRSSKALVPASEFALTYSKGQMLELRARALVPFSSILIDFDMAVSTRVFGKFRRLVVKMIQDDGTEEKND